MKKQTLKSSGEQYHDFSIFNISATIADYMLAFHLNKSLEIKLARQVDLPVYLAGDSPVFFSLFYFKDDVRYEYYLIQDITGQDQLLNSFLFLLKGHFQETMLENIIETISKMSDIFSINAVAPDEKLLKRSKTAKTIQFINTILTDLEIHILEINRRREEIKVKLKPTRTKSIRKLYD